MACNLPLQQKSQGPGNPTSKECVAMKDMPTTPPGVVQCTATLTPVKSQLKDRRVRPQ